MDCTALRGSKSHHSGCSPAPGSHENRQYTAGDNGVGGVQPRRRKPDINVLRNSFGRYFQAYTRLDRMRTDKVQQGQWNGGGARLIHMKTIKVRFFWGRGAAVGKEAIARKGQTMTCFETVNEPVLTIPGPVVRIQHQRCICMPHFVERASYRL